MMNKKGQEDMGAVIIIIVVIVALIIIFAGALMYIMPQYNVWSKELDGKAQYKEAEWNRQITIKEAEARLEAEKLNAQSEIERAKGVAESNEIIGQGLKNNEEYLKYLWIQGLNNNNQNVIYVPTEANLPILEATRLGGIPNVK